MNSLTSYKPPRVRPPKYLQRTPIRRYTSRSYAPRWEGPAVRSPSPRGGYHLDQTRLQRTRRSWTTRPQLGHFLRRRGVIAKMTPMQVCRNRKPQRSMHPPRLWAAGNSGRSERPEHDLAWSSARPSPRFRVCYTTQYGGRHSNPVTDRAGRPFCC